jgi:outer membrane protein, heavy metal efflux system
MGRGAGWGIMLVLALLCACATPPPAPITPEDTLASFSERRLGQSRPGLPPASAGWDRQQWLSAALALNPRLAEERARVEAVAAAERTAAEHPNPSLELFGEYLTAASQSASWLYGLSMDFLLREPGARSRARQQAALESALARSDLADELWQIQAALRLALLDAAAAQAQGALLTALIEARQGLLRSDRARLELGDLARPQLLTDELELARAEQRQREAEAREVDAVSRLAAAVGVPAAALADVPVRWSEWQGIDALTVGAAAQWRRQALIGRPQIVHALREYDLAELALRGELAKRWPQVHVTPAYAWGGGGLRDADVINNNIETESALGLSFELPIFNQHQGAIGEALARRAAAGAHLKAVQAEIFAQIDRAEANWSAARRAWQDTREQAQLAEHLEQAEAHALAAGESERPSLITAQVATTEARLVELQAAYTAQLAFGGLEDAYRRPLGPGAPES